MRTIWPAVLVLALAAPAPSSASALNPLGKHHYDTCSRHFGYGNVCQDGTPARPKAAIVPVHADRLQMRQLTIVVANDR
jgi:hypothetical protein